MDKPVLPRIYLSPPHMSGEELEFVKNAFASNWIAPLGPQVDAFEAEIAEYLGVSHAAALVSGTAGNLLALRCTRNSRCGRGARRSISRQARRRTWARGRSLFQWEQNHHHFRRRNARL